MILSDKYKFIFIRQQKIGGSTMENNGIAVIDPNYIKFTKDKCPGEDPNHMCAETIEKLIPYKYDNYFRFTFVRNPWARLVSLYFHMNLGASDKTWRKKYHAKDFNPYKKPFDQFIKECDNKVWANSHLPMKEFAGDVDYIGKTENLQDDFDYICECIGAPQQDIGWINKGNHKSYIEYYTDETREIVAQRYAEDIKMFDYEFGK